MSNCMSINEKPNAEAMRDMCKHLRDKPLMNPQICEGKITESEVLEVLLSLKLGKACGSDGLSSEFFKSHAHEVCPFLTSYYNAIHEQGFLPDIMRDGLICILFKNKGERSHLKNYRPITLLNTTLKILTSVLAKRLAAVMCEISDVDNTAAAPGRFISDNTMLLQLIQAFLDDEELPGVAIWFDMEK